MVDVGPVRGEGLEERGEGQGRGREEGESVGDGGVGFSESSSVSISIQPRICVFRVFGPGKTWGFKPELPSVRLHECTAFLVYLPSQSTERLLPL